MALCPPSASSPAAKIAPSVAFASASAKSPTTDANCIMTADVCRECFTSADVATSSFSTLPFRFVTYSATSRKCWLSTTPSGGAAAPGPCFVGEVGSASPGGKLAASPVMIAGIAPAAFPLARSFSLRDPSLSTLEAPGSPLSDEAAAPPFPVAAATVASLAAYAASAAPWSNTAAVPVSSSLTVFVNQSLTPLMASEVTPRSYHGTRSAHDVLFCSSRNTRTSGEALRTGCAATRATNCASVSRRASIAALVGSSFGTSVFGGGAGTMIPSEEARSIFHSHSKSLYRRVTHPEARSYDGSVVQYVTLYSTCLLMPSPTLCGSETSTWSVPGGSSYPAGTVTTTLGGSGRGPTSMLTGGAAGVPRLGDFGVVGSGTGGYPEGAEEGDSVDIAEEPGEARRGEARRASVAAERERARAWEWG